MSGNRVASIFRVVAVCAALASAPAAHAAAIGTLDLSNASVVGQTARFQLFLEFATDIDPVGDKIEVIEPSVWGSHPLLTSSNTNFGRFSFSLAAGELPSWQELDPMGAGTWPWLGMYEAPRGDPGIPPRPGSPYHVGTLDVNLAGLPPDTLLNVTLAGGTIPGTSTDLGGFVGGLALPYAPGTNNDETDPAWLVFADPNGVAFRTPGEGPPPDYVIPEPMTLATLFLGLGAVVLRSRTRRH